MGVFIGSVLYLFSKCIFFARVIENRTKTHYVVYQTYQQSQSFALVQGLWWKRIFFDELSMTIMIRLIYVCWLTCFVKCLKH